MGLLILWESKKAEELSLDKRTRNEYGKAAISELMLDKTLKFQGEEMMEKKKIDREKGITICPRTMKEGSRGEDGVPVMGTSLCPPLFPVMPQNSITHSTHILHPYYLPGTI